VWAAIDAAPAIKAAPNSSRMERDKGGAFRGMGYPHLLDRTGKRSIDWSVWQLKRFEPRLRNRPGEHN
jgi:hypothetical protein